MLEMHGTPWWADGTEAVHSRLMVAKVYCLKQMHLIFNCYLPHHLPFLISCSTTFAPVCELWFFSLSGV